MRSFALLTGALLCAAAAGPALACPEHTAASAPPHDHGSPPASTADHADEGVGEVDLVTSCAPEVEARVENAFAVLHSFWYAEALRRFEAIAAEHPGCAMAHQGVALSLYNPLWAPPSPASLARGLSAIRAARAAARTPLERDWAEAVAAFYEDHTRVGHDRRVAAFERAMARLHAKYPEDVEVTVFHALALNAAASPEDKTYRRQKEAGALLERVIAAHPDHPGASHYLIHSYDNPELAPRALGAARRYAAIAPAVPHARHMPSHIFTRLGLWEEAIRSDLSTVEAAASHETPGGPVNWERLHSYDYLAYAYLQTAQDDRVRALLDEIRAMGRADPHFGAAYAVGAIPARWVLERRAWDEAAELALPGPVVDWGPHGYALAPIHFARALGQARSGRPEAAKVEVAALERIARAVGEDNASTRYWAGQVRLQATAARAWVALSEGSEAEALRQMEEAVRVEAGTDKHPVTPGAVVPMVELHGEMLLELGRPAEALAAFERSLELQPGRFAAHHGAARAARALGRRDAAERHYRALLALAAPGATRPALGEARAYLAVPTSGR